MNADAAAAVRLSKTILASRSVSVVWIDLEHALAATELLRTHGDKRWSFTDCTSFVVMDRLRIQEAFTFDHNFEEAGFVRLP